jgi:amylo-alpha-1,6-glucosidase
VDHPADLPVEPLRRVSSIDSRAPILLSGLSAAAVLGASGDLSLIRETRGADIDWGGVYGEGVRLTGPWWIRFGGPQQLGATLAESLQQLESSRTRVTSLHAAGPVRCDQEIVALAELPGVGRRLNFVNTTDRAIVLRTESTFRPELAPVLIEGIKPFEYDVSRAAAGVRVTAFGSALEFGSSLPNSTIRLNDQSWDGRPFRGALDTVTLDSTLDLPSDQSVSVSYLIWGGAEATVRGHPERTAELLAAAGSWGTAAEALRREWTDSTPGLRLPAAPELERAYLLARDVLRSLYFAPEPGFVGLVAGYPWYAALWCRDLAWMLPAVLWLGDAPWVAASLRSVFRFQARAALPILGGSAGELPMQIGPGPIFLYGTSDTTLYYPDLVRRYWAHTGDPSLVRELTRPLLLAEQWARAKTNPATGLIHNGDEGAGLRQSAEEHGRVHFGFDAFDTTIWDSTDRRAHAVDIQVLWADALAALGELGPAMDPMVDGTRWVEESQRLRQGIADRYWWQQETYLYDSIADDGTPVTKVRPNALLAVARGLLPRDRARAAVGRAAQDDLSTLWGIRTLSSRHPTYNPISYHDGQVWPIASAWAIAAAFAVGDVTRAVDDLRAWAGQLDREFGTLNECYRGDRPEPFDSCFLLGFSIAPFLTQIFEGLWGLRPSARERTVTVEPQFPASWSEGSFTGLALFGGHLSLSWTRPQLSVNWSGPGLLRVQCGAHTLQLDTGDSGTLPCDATRPLS